MKKVVKKVGAMLNSLLVAMWFIIDVKGCCLSNYTEKELADMGIKF